MCAWVGSLFLATNGCGPNEAECREVVAEQGMTDIVMTRASDGFDFTAKKGKLTCRGHVTSFQGSSMVSSTCSDETQTPIAELKPDCSAEHAEVCYEQAKQKDKAKDLAAAIPLYAKGCDFGHGESCNDLGVAYARGEGVAPDEGKATALYDRACKLEVVLGCFNLGHLYTRTNKLPEALPLLQSACDQKLAEGCFELGLLALRGKGVEEDAAKALELFKRACEQEQKPSLQACGAIGVVYDNGGKGVPVDRVKAAQYLTAACDKNLFEACKNLGILVRGNKVNGTPPAAANALFEKACNGNDGAGCNELGLAYERATNVPKDLGKAASLYQRACELEEPMGCSNWGITLKDGVGVTKDLAKAADAFDRACKAGLEKGCSLGRTLPSKAPH